MNLFGWLFLLGGMIGMFGDTDTAMRATPFMLSGAVFLMAASIVDVLGE